MAFPADNGNEGPTTTWSVNTFLAEARPTKTVVVSVGSGYEDNRWEGFWASPTAEIVKWSIVAGVFLIIFIWFVAGYYHAKRRVKKGLKPLPYHKFLLPRAQRAKSKPQNNISFYRREEPGYRMDSYAPPPPVYDPNLAAPPGYNGPPQGSSKADSSQEWIAPPPGAPPGQPATSDVEQGLPSDPVKAEPAKGGMFQKFKPRIPKINLFGK